MDTDSIIEKWASLNYNSWHVQRETIIEENENNTIENEWEMISTLHNVKICKNQKYIC